MQAEKAARLRQDWAKKGNPPCPHPSLDKEYFLGGDSGDYVCTVCGHVITPGDPKHPRSPKQ